MTNISQQNQKPMNTNTGFFKTITAALIVLKVGQVGHFSELTWAFILSPIIIGIFVSYVSAIFEGIDLRDRIRSEAETLYLDRVRRKATEKAIRETTLKVTKKD